MTTRSEFPPADIQATIHAKAASEVTEYRGWQLQAFQLCEEGFIGRIGVSHYVIPAAKTNTAALIWLMKKIDKLCEDHPSLVETGFFSQAE